MLRNCPVCSSPIRLKNVFGYCPKHQEGREAEEWDLGLLSTPQVADTVECTDRQVRQWAFDNQISYEKKGKRYRIPYQELPRIRSRVETGEWPERQYVHRGPHQPQGLQTAEGAGLPGSQPPPNPVGQDEI